MSGGERWVVLGLAHVRSPWFTDLARWSTAAVLPIEFVKCLSGEEVRARLASSRPFSALVVDGGLPAIDRDLVDLAATAGCRVVVVDDERVPGDQRWRELGAIGTLPPGFGPDDLLDLLAHHAPLIGHVDRSLHSEPAPTITMVWRGRLVAVTGGGGTGTSTVAMAIAQWFGADERYRDRVVLADLALHADQALLHHTGDVVPGLQELVDAHRLASPGPDEIRACTVRPERAPYALLMGLRRHRDWAALRPRAVDAALDGLRRTFTAVVADVEPDFEGEADTGAADLEDRNLLARTAVRDADLVVITALPSVAGMQRLVRLIRDVVDFGVAPARVVPLINRAPRNPAGRADLQSAVAQLTAISGEAPVNPPVFVPDRKRTAVDHRDGVGVAPALAATAGRAVQAVLDRNGELPRPVLDAGPARIVPGSLGAWTSDEEGVAG